MNYRTRICVLGGLGLAGSLVPATRADITGFNNLVGWSYNQGDAGTPATFGQDFIQITTGGANQVRSVWFNTPQAISEFTATFTYRAASIGPAAVRQGVSFIIQTDPRGTAAIGAAFNSTGFGFDGITPSAGVTIELDTGPGLTYSGFYRNGIIGTPAVTTPLNAFQGRDIEVSIVYNGTSIAVSMHDSVNTFPTQNYLVSPSFAAALGSSAALVGFGASTGAQNGCNQFISNFRYTVPAPGTAALLALGMCVRRRRCAVT
jgi:hypothetical protein